MATLPVMEPGDVVVLLSGGPQMTVELVFGNGTKMNCVWFAGERVVRDTFDVALVRYAENNNG